MTDKPTHEKIARELRRMLYGNAKPSDNDYAQCRTMQVSYPDLAKICRKYGLKYDEPKDIPDELLDQVYEAARKIYTLIVGCGNYTVLVGGDFHCKPKYPDYGFEVEVLPKPAPESEPPAETDKPTPEEPEEIARELRRMLYGNAKPSNNDYAQCRTMQVSYPDFAEICRKYGLKYDEPKDIPDELFIQVGNAALKINLLVGWGNYTVLVGGDFHCDCDPQSLYPEYGFKEA